jgi:hypothetical protein
MDPDATEPPKVPAIRPVGAHQWPHYRVKTTVSNESRAVHSSQQSPGRRRASGAKGRHSVIALAPSEAGPDRVDPCAVVPHCVDVLRAGATNLQETSRYEKVHSTAFLATELPARTWLQVDIVAGLTIMALLVPEGMAYAELAGVPPQAAFCAAPIGLLLYAAFGRSRQLTVAVSSGEVLTATQQGVASEGYDDSHDFASPRRRMAVN